MNRLWHPTENDVTLARWATIMAMSVIFLVALVLGLLVSELFAFVLCWAGFILLILLRAIVLVRGAYSLPLTDYDVEKHKMFNPRWRKGCLALGLAMPLATTPMFFLRAEWFPGAFMTTTLMGIVLLSYAEITSVFFLTISAIYLMFFCLIVATQYAGFVALVMTLLIAGMILPDYYAKLVISNKVVDVVRGNILNCKRSDS